MATGYTMDIHDGKPVTFDQFALKCSRALGAAIMQRDESPDVEIRMCELDDYYATNVEKAQAKLDDASALSDAEWLSLQADELEEAKKFSEEYIAERDAVRSRYTQMLEQVEGWVPPTGEHEGLKKFMIEQLQDSIKWDCGDYTPHVPEALPVHEYRAKKIESLAKSLGYAAESLAKEKALVASQNAWVTALRDSLKVGVS